MNERLAHMTIVQASAKKAVEACLQFCSGSRLLPFFIVSLFACTMAYTEYVTTGYIVAQKMGEPPDWMDALLVIQCIGGYCIQLMIWVACAAVVHLTATILDGDGTFTDLLFFWGYGYIPLAITAYCLFILFSGSLDSVASLAFSTKTSGATIPGLETVRALAQFAQLSVVAWGIYSVIRIHHLSLRQSLFSILVPALSFIVLRYLFTCLHAGH